MPRLNRNDYIFTFASLVVITLIAYLLYWHSRQRGILSEDLKPVGVVEYRYREVLRKFSDRMMWEDLEAAEEIYLYDSIMTNGESDAKITMQNGLKIQIEPNSMVEIDMTGNTANIALKGGIVHTEGSSGAQAVVTTADGTRMELKSANSRIASTEDTSELAITEGSASVEKSGQKSNINSGESLMRDARGNIIKKKFAIKLVKPEDGIIVTRPDEPVAFQWVAPSPTDHCSVQVKDAAGNARKFSARGNSVHKTLPPGNYVWQVLCETAPQQNEAAIPEGESLAATLRVRPATALRIVYPHTGEKIPRNQAEDLVFRWDLPGSDDVVASTFSLSQKADFSKTVLVEDSSSGLVKPPVLKPGEYYWKVEPKSRNGYKPVVSHFTISQHSELLPYADPKSDKRVFIEPDAAEGRAHLVWKHPGPQHSFRISISKNGKLIGPAGSHKTQENSWTAALPPGKYSWKISVYDHDYQRLLFSSKPVSLEIIRRPLPKAPRVKSVTAGP